MDGYTVPESFTNPTWDTIHFTVTGEGVSVEIAARPVAMVLLAARLIANIEQTAPNDAIRNQMRELFGRAVSGFVSLPEELHFMVWGPLTEPPMESTPETEE